MSSAKRALLKAVRSWLRSRGPAPQILRACDVCGDEGWRPLDRIARSVVRVVVDAQLPDGSRADLALVDDQGRPRLLVQLDGGSRLPNRSDAGCGFPVVVLAGDTALASPLAWRPVRERNQRPWRCRCSQARVLPVDDGFSLRAIGCPINLRREEGGSYANVIQDCSRCAFFVGIGYAGGERRRVSLYCAYGSPLHDRFGPGSASRLIAPRVRPRPPVLRALAPA
jgi:hypothetical protein